MPVGMIMRKRDLISQQQIEGAVFTLRGEQVLLDADLADMYGVKVGELNRAVKRNRARFPDDFMFQLSQDEWTALRCQIGILDGAGQASPSGLRSQSVTSTSDNDSNRSQFVTGSQATLRSQIVILKRGRGRHRKYLPYAFTEQGVAMLSSVLRSERAVRVNVEIMRAFVRLRKVLAVNRELAARLDELERRVGKHDEQFIQVIRAIRQLMEPPAAPPKRKIGFHVAADDQPSARLPGVRRK